MELSNTDYAVVVGLLGIWTAILWRVIFVLFRGIERSLDEFKTVTSERFDRQDAAIREGFARQDERFDRQDERFARQDERFDRQDAAIKEGFARQDERFARQDERFARQDGRFDRLERRLDKQDEHLERHGALLLQLVRDVGLLTGALIGIPGKEREKVGSRE